MKSKARALAQINALIDALDRSDAPGAAVGVSVGGEVVVRGGWGRSSLDQPVLLTPSTRMRLASVSKHMTCLAFLLLCEEGKADIADPVRKHFPELERLAPQITMRHLMGHVSGLRDVHDLRYLFGGVERLVSAAELFDFYNSVSDVNFESGAAYCYNNGGYLLLSLAIERLSGLDLDEFLARRIFRPLHMEDTFLRRFDSSFVDNSAALHSSRSDGGYQRSYVNKEHLGEGGIVSTVDDMLKWLRHMDSPVVGGSESWSALLTPVKLNSGKPTGYGLGITVAEYRGRPILCHSGGLFGCNSHMLKIPDAALDIIVLANCNTVSAVDLAYRIADAALGIDRDKDAANSKLPLINALYRSTSTGKLLHLYGQSERQIASLNGAQTVVTRDLEGAFRPVPVERDAHQYLIPCDLSSNPPAVEAVDHGLRETYVRVPDPGTPRLFEGRYQGETVAASLSILEDRRFEATSSFGKALYRLEPLGGSLWLAQSCDGNGIAGVLGFDHDGQTLIFSSGRSWALPFRRMQ